jgi:hypothetical protein
MMAILDRLLHHGEVFSLRGASYRLRGKEPVVLGSGAGGTSPDVLGTISDERR